MMEEVLEKLETTIITPSADENKSSFDGLYKNWGKLGNQEQRRKDILETQKGNRNTKLDKFRGILELVNAVEEREIFTNYKNIYRPSIYVAGFTRTSLSYSNVLMLSEWMIEKPEDFEENWYVVPCPKGTRVLLVANNGSTKCYTKYGHFKFECRTALPGGSRCQHYRGRCCVLDCFYDEKNSTMYVLDILAWNAQPMTDGETEFRHFWMQTQLAELKELKVINKVNKLIFKLLPKVPCSKESFNEFMMKNPQFENNTVSLDGLLFYHKRAHYFAGQTPLVGWLFPYMVPEVIGADVTISPHYMAGKPATYVNQAEFIQKFEEKNNKKKDTRRRRKSSMMDTVEPVENNTESESTVPEPPKTEESMESVDVGPTTLEDMEAVVSKQTDMESIDVNPTTLEDMEEAVSKQTDMESIDVNPTTLEDMEAAVSKQTDMESIDVNPTTLEDMEAAVSKQTDMETPHSLESGDAQNIPDDANTKVDDENTEDMEVTVAKGKKSKKKTKKQKATEEDTEKME